MRQLTQKVLNGLREVLSLASSDIESACSEEDGAERRVHYDDAIEAMGWIREVTSDGGAPRFIGASRCPTCGRGSLIQPYLSSEPDTYVCMRCGIEFEVRLVRKNEHGGHR